MRIQAHHLLTQTASQVPDAPAVTSKGVTWTYGELSRHVWQVAASLRELGLARGDRVAVYLDKRPETVTAFFASSAAGGCFVPVNPLLRPQQVAHILTDCDARVLVTTRDRLVLLADVLIGCKALEHVVIVGDGAAGQPEPVPPSPTALTVLDWPRAGDQHGIGPDRSPDPAPVADLIGTVDTDMAAIFYTSGSTGRPKGVVLSHRNLIVGAESVAHYLGNTGDDVILSALPLSFDAGFSQLTTAFAVGAHVVLHNYLLPADVVRLCAEHGVTGLTCVPPLWLQLAAQTWPEPATRHLRYFANTGGRMPRTTLDRLRSIFPAARPFLMYGLTEAFRSTYLDPDQVDRRPDSIGKAIPNADVRVLRADGTECAPGESGELVHRGPLVALGYWNDVQRTAERFRPVPSREPGLTFPELAVWSGDMATRDEEGYLYFVGRDDEMIKTSGYRVSPMEIEEVAYDTGLVTDAVAFGVADGDLGQRIVLVVSPAGEGLDESVLAARMRKVLPLYMVPHRIQVRPQIPRSPNGKFDRALLRQEMTT